MVAHPWYGIDSRRVERTGSVSQVLKSPQNEEVSRNQPEGESGVIKSSEPELSGSSTSREEK